MMWGKVKLGDVCVKIGSGATPKGGATVYVDEGTTFIRSQNVYNLSFDYNGLVFINDEAAQKLKGVTIEENDVLLNITGDSVARTCLVPSEVLPARVNQHVAIVRPNSDILNPIYLNYYLASPFMQSYMLGLAVGKGASRNAMTKDMIAGFEVPCPPMEIQKKIVDILKPYDDLIKNNQKQIRLLEEAARRLYKEWFVDLCFPGHEDVAIVDGVPEGWNVTTVEECAEVLRRGISPKYNEHASTMVINQKCIRQTVVDYKDARRQEKAYSSDLALKDSDTVICSTGSGTLGRVGQIFGDISDATIDSHVTLVRAKESVGKQFLFWTLKEYQRYFMNAGRGSTNQLELSRETIGLCKVKIANTKCFEMFEEYAQEIHKRITVCTKQLGLLTEARDRLLSKLMSGEMNV